MANKGYRPYPHKRQFSHGKHIFFVQVRHSHISADHWWAIVRYTRGAAEDKEILTFETKDQATQALAVLEKILTGV